MARVLIVYGTTEGHTAAIAETGSAPGRSVKSGPAVAARAVSATIAAPALSPQPYTYSPDWSSAASVRRAVCHRPGAERRTSISRVHRPAPSLHLHGAWPPSTHAQKSSICRCAD